MVAFNIADLLFCLRIFYTMNGLMMLFPLCSDCNFLSKISRIFSRKLTENWFDVAFRAVNLHGFVRSSDCHVPEFPEI